MIQLEIVLVLHASFFIWFCWLEGRCILLSISVYFVSLKNIHAVEPQQKLWYLGTYDMI